jgi:hypothetical protein
MERNIDRPITPKEAAIVQWLLDHAPVGDVTAYREKPVGELRVVAGCDCGCCSLHFEPPGPPHPRRIADATARYADGQQAYLMLWGRDGRTVWLEVSDCQPGSSHRVPEISNLRTWEEFGQELLQR